MNMTRFFCTYFSRNFCKGSRHFAIIAGGLDFGDGKCFFYLSILKSSYQFCIVIIVVNVVMEN